MNFSGNFGGELEGRGVGLAVTRSITMLYRGSLELGGLPGHCTEATATFQRDAAI